MNDDANPCDLCQGRSARLALAETLTSGHSVQNPDRSETGPLPDQNGRRARETA